MAPTRWHSPKRSPSISSSLTFRCQGWAGQKSLARRIARRPAGRVLIDYNHNAWGRTLASAYSPRPRPLATVSAPITWDELDAGARIEQFNLRNMPGRIAEVGDLWAPLLATEGRFDLAPLFAALR